MTEKEIARINELYHKSKSTGLTPQEEEEQKNLRKAYIASIRENMRNNLESIKIQQPDGTLISVKDEHEKKISKSSEDIGS